MCQDDPLYRIQGIMRKTFQSSLSFILNLKAKKKQKAKVKSYIKGSNDFLWKIASLPSLPDDIILCTRDVVGTIILVSIYLSFKSKLSI